MVGLTSTNSKSVRLASFPTADLTTFSCPKTNNSVGVRIGYRTHTRGF